MSNYPKGAIIPHEVIIPGAKRCENCTHYEEDHLEGYHCRHLMFEYPMDVDEKKFANAGYQVQTARQLCDCKRFVK